MKYLNTLLLHLDEMNIFIRKDVVENTKFQYLLERNW